MVFLKKVLALFFIVLFPMMVSAQTVITVLDAENGNPIPGVLIRLSNQTKLIADENGQARANLNHQLTALFSHLAYEDLWKNLEPGKTDTVRLFKKTNSLSEVIVSSFGSTRSLLEQAAAVSQVNEKELYRFNETSLVNAFNTRSGVRMEERAPGSYRISIRGSSLRAPFGVRNVKIYWDDIPFTAPDGTTPLNILDLSNVQNTEIIKGPAGSIYGAGNGGVISFTPKKIKANSANADLAVGDFGLLKYRLGMEQLLENGDIYASFVQQKSDGYRDHSALDRKVFNMGANFYPSNKQSISTQLLYSDLFYELPGGLTSEQVAENPQQARPGSAAQNASINQKSLYGTFVHEYDFNTKWSNKSAAYIQTTDFENPFNLDYKKETQYGYGGRTKFTLNDQWGQFPVRLLLGGEYQFSNTSAQNFGNRNGQADTVRFSDDLITTQGFLFQQVEVNWTKNMLMTLALSENFSRFDINRNIDASTGLPYAVERKFNPVWVPRLAFSAKINRYSALFGSISAGFSPPTIDEVRTNEGSINLDLEAEKGINYEMGYRGNYSDGKINLDISTFYFKLDETITTYTNEQGVVLFRNAGATDQKGIEAQIDYSLIRSNTAWLQELKLGHAYSFHHFLFKNYVNDGEDFSGNMLTGVPQNNLVNRLDVETQSGLYLNVTHQFVSELPLNDANTVMQDSYNLLNARLGWRGNLSNKLELEIYGGADNLLDEQYSLGNDLNAFGGRYYQPAALRNFYGGIKVKMRY
ncbi:TonB-dependent receptor domain-containing protein [Echinicola sp. 20G]|uniref:TonB-dependent receptor domain-containing protein n=1 Tax=Echinicola sp. 20G TaxID=2781961 RepID=UPI00191058B7